MDRGAWWATVHGVAKSQTELSEYTHSHMHACMHACMHAHTHTRAPVMIICFYASWPFVYVLYRNVCSDLFQFELFVFLLMSCKSPL